MTSADPHAIKDTIRRFILGSIPFFDLDDEADMFDSGAVNSLFVVQLMTFIEKTFAIEVSAEDLEIENFKSLNATTAFVLRKKQSAPRPVCASY